LGAHTLRFVLGVYVRPLTYVKYNHEGDWFFTCAKDHHPTVWNGETGERIGTYNGHNGAVWSCDVTRDTKRLVTASADMTMILWEAEGGQKLYQHSFDGPARYTEFSLGEREIVVTVDAFMGSDANIQVLTVSDDRNECTCPQRVSRPGDELLVALTHQRRRVYQPGRRAGHPSALWVCKGVSAKESGHFLRTRVSVPCARVVCGVASWCHSVWVWRLGAIVCGCGVLVP
jgi:hypothetical protein